MVKKKREIKKLDIEQQARKDKLKVERAVSKAALKIMETNPEVRREMVSKSFNLEIPTLRQEKIDQVAALIDEMVIKEINDNPVLRRDIVNARIEQLMEELGMVKQGEQWRRKPPTMDYWIREFDKVNKLKEVLGIKSKGFFEQLLSPEVITAVLTVAIEILKSRQPETPQEEKRIWVLLDGIPVGLTPEQLKEFEAEGRVKVLAEIEPILKDSQEKGNNHAGQVPGNNNDKAKSEDSGSK